MSRVTPINPDLVYLRDSSWWPNSSGTSGHAYHRPSQQNEGWAACSRRIMLDTESGLPRESAGTLMCRRPACRGPVTT